MVRCMKVGGEITRPTVKGDLFTPMVMSMMETGLMIKLMDLVYTAILMELNMKANGKRTNNMVMVLKPGQMVLDIRENTSKERNTAKDNSLGLMAALSLDSLSITILRVLENTIGQMEESLMDPGKTIRWKEVELSHGQTVEDTKVTTSMIRKKDKDLSIGQTVENMKVAGRMESNTELELIHPLVERQSKESGKKVRDFTGFQTNDQDKNCVKMQLFLKFYKRHNFISKIYIFNFYIFFDKM